MPRLFKFYGYLRLVQTRCEDDIYKQRLGQHYSNALADVAEDLYFKMIRERPDLDPFYNDKNIPAFLAFVAEYWDEV